MKEVVVTAFARSIFAKVELLGSADLNPRERPRVLEALDVDIRKYTDLIDPKASDAALAVAATLPVDLHSVRWHDQPKFDRGRKLFVLEHVVPVKSIRDDCLLARSESEVAQRLAKVMVAWICREEDRKLTSLGYRSARADPEGAYRAAGISLAGLTYEMPERSVDA
ncbi:MAG: hypothetical protein ACT4PI_11750 [Actinomycetota bacterium]